MKHKETYKKGIGNRVPAAASMSLTWDLVCCVGRLVPAEWGLVTLATVSCTQALHLMALERSYGQASFHDITAAELHSA